MDKIEKFFVVTLFTVFTAYFLDKTADILRESNALLLTEALNTSPGFIVSVSGYNEVFIIGIPILLGFIGGVLAAKLSERNQNEK